MVQLRRGKVVAVDTEHAAVLRCVVEVDGAPRDALAYRDLTPEIAEGDVVTLNTTATTLGLGTGGLDFILAVEGREQSEHPGGHAMKLRYTPLQTSVDAVEETHREIIDGVSSLDGHPIVVAGLHSALAPVLIGARTVAPTLRTAYVMTDAAALHIGFSSSVAALRDAGLLDVTITTGQALGGDHEAVTLFGGLAAARAVAEAELVVVAQGPGNLGTGSRWGFASIEVAAIVNAVSAMGGTPVVAPRVSFADARERHHGLSHHTVTALSLALARARVAFPPLEADRHSRVKGQASPLYGRHDMVEVNLPDDVERALKESPVELRSMRRSYDDDPDYFRAAAAAGVLAARSLDG